MAIFTHHHEECINIWHFGGRIESRRRSAWSMRRMMRQVDGSTGIFIISIPTGNLSERVQLAATFTLTRLSSRPACSVWCCMPPKTPWHLHGVTIPITLLRPGKKARTDHGVTRPAHFYLFVDLLIYFFSKEKCAGSLRWRRPITR